MILASQVHQIAGTLEAVSMDLAGEDSYLHLARELPDIAGAGLAEVATASCAATAWSTRRSTTGSSIPGGRRIIENVQEALELSREDVATSWAALADHGNVGTPVDLLRAQGHHRALRSPCRARTG